IPFLKAKDAACLNAISLESTGWYEPSYNVALICVIGNPAKYPLSRDSSSPFSTAGKKFLGTEPPNTSSSNSNSSSDGSNLINTSPNCPAPPDCFLCLP